MWFIRLLVSPFIMLAYMVMTMLLVVCYGFGWIFTGDAYVEISWPSVH